MSDDPIQQPARNASQSDAGGDQSQTLEPKPEEVKPVGENPQKI